MSRFIPETVTAFQTTLKAHVVIQRPMPSVQARGVASGNKQVPTITIRLQDKYKTAIEDASELTGMTRSEFIRWVSYFAALDILEQYKKFQDSRPR